MICEGEAVAFFASRTIASTGTAPRKHALEA
jgi:hypothetical protein